MPGVECGGAAWWAMAGTGGDSRARRAALLIRRLGIAEDLQNLPTRAQNAEAGVIYPFMRRAARHMALGRYFPILKFCLGMADENIRPGAPRASAFIAYRGAEH